MTTRSTLSDTVLVGTMDGSGKKRKLVLVALAFGGLIFLLRSRGSDSKSEEMENEYVEEEIEAEEEIEIETESEKDKFSAREELVEARRELDMFDMLAILAAAIKAARDEYNQRA